MKAAQSIRPGGRLQQAGAAAEGLGLQKKVGWIFGSVGVGFVLQGQHRVAGIGVIKKDPAQCGHADAQAESFGWAVANGLPAHQPCSAISSDISSGCWLPACHSGPKSSPSLACS